VDLAWRLDTDERHRASDFGRNPPRRVERLLDLFAGLTERIRFGILAGQHILRPLRLYQQGERRRSIARARAPRRVHERGRLAQGFAGVALTGERHDVRKVRGGPLFPEISHQPEGGKPREVVRAALDQRLRALKGEQAGAWRRRHAVTRDHRRRCRIRKADWHVMVDDDG